MLIVFGEDAGAGKWSILASVKPLRYWVILCFVASQTLTGQSTEPPNILFIAADDLNDYVGCLDSLPGVRTPNIDRLAARGVTFTNAHCQAPLCGPSRASLMSGRLASTTGIYAMIDDENIRRSSPANDSIVLLPEYFQANGYQTAGVGKLFHQGDRAGAFQEYGGGFSWFGPRPKRRVHYDPEWFGKPPGTSTDWGGYPPSDTAMTDRRVADWAINRLERGFTAPFFLGVGFLRPHVPWYVPPHWLDSFALADIDLPPYRSDDWDDVPAFARELYDVPMMPTTEWARETGVWPEMVRAYLASIAFMDHQVGRVLDALDASPYANNTVIILFSDHGYHLGEKGRFAKHSLWRQATRVPLLIAGPGVEGKQTVAAPVGLIDLYPTLADLTGLSIPTGLEGHTLCPLFDDPAAAWPHVSVTTYGYGNHSLHGQRYHYIRYHDGSEELYDLAADPAEWTNLAGDGGFWQILEAFRGKLPTVNTPNVPLSTYNVNAYFRQQLPYLGRPD